MASKFDEQCARILEAGQGFHIQPESVADLQAQRDALLAALKACIANHCGNANLFCSTCSPARTLIASINEKGRP